MIEKGEYNDFCSTERVHIWWKISQYIFVPHAFASSATADSADLISWIRIRFETVIKLFGSDSRVWPEQSGTSKAT
jgi:hypothetical protein